MVKAAEEATQDAGEALVEKLKAEAKSMPKLDFTRVPRRRWWKQWNRLTAQATKLQMRAEDAAHELRESDDDEGSRNERPYLELYAETMDELEAIGERQQELICQVLESVPEDWWHQSAPDDVDLSDPENLDWLDDGRFEDLVRLLQGESKNLQRPTSSASSPPDRSRSTQTKSNGSTGRKSR